jgi:hypothetical protein
VPFWKTFFRVTVPVCLPVMLDLSRYLFVNAMTTVSAVVFLYSPDTTLASVAIVNLDEAGDIGAAAAMATLVVVTSAAVCFLYFLLQRFLERRTQPGEPDDSRKRPDPPHPRPPHDVARDQAGDAARLGLVGRLLQTRLPLPSARTWSPWSTARRRTCACRSRGAERSPSRRRSRTWCRATARCSSPTTAPIASASSRFLKYIARAGAPLDVAEDRVVTGAMVEEALKADPSITHVAQCIARPAPGS